MKKLISLLILTLLWTSTFSQSQTSERAKWFTDARYGMFVHWGIYSAAEGYWKGEKIRNDNDYAEWIFYRNSISKEEYVTLLDRFDWDKINPEEWVILAKKAGMKYVTFTAKHHDGFALWDSQASKYDLGDFTNHKRDIVKELAEACKKHGLKLGLYYSHWVDWEHEFGWDHKKELTGITPEQYNKYWQEKVIPQMRELLTNYCEISMIWFDMWIHHSQTVVTKEQLFQLKKLIRELQPNCLINSRLGLSIEEDPDVDFKELGDNSLGDKKEDFPWQSPATVAHSWGFHATDSEWKSTTTLLKALINNVSLNGNLLLNIGPRANGDVPWEIQQRLLEMGNWLTVNGESVYGAGAFDLPKNQHDWGKITCKKAGEKTTLYYHVFNWPLNKKLFVTGISSKPGKIWLLSNKEENPLKFTHKGAYTEIELPDEQPDQFVSVIAAEYASKPEISEGLVAKTKSGGYSFLPGNQIVPVNPANLVKKEKYGTIPDYLLIEKPETFTWKIFVDTPGRKRFDISYSYQNNSNPAPEIILAIANQKISVFAKPTGKTVGEPNNDWIIDNFSSNRIGEINFPEAGFYEIEMQIIPSRNDNLKFQWIWAE